MTILLTLYLAGMPLALVTILWALVGIGEEDWQDLATLPGLAALVLFVALWPVFLAVSLYQVWQER